MGACKQLSHHIVALGKRLSSWLKQAGNLISLSFLVFLLGFLFRFAIEGSLFGGSIDSARYLLSALAQTQGAIIAIVISLTIVAVQVSSQAYSLRITNLLLKYEFFWFMLFLYGLSIIYDVTLLNRINDSNIGSLGAEVNVSILIAAIVLWGLFPYTKKTIERLRPQTIVRILGKHILSNNKGTFASNRRETIFPLFDTTKRAIRTDDIATARDGIKEIEKVCCGIISEKLSEEDERKAVGYFCEQYQRTAKIASAQNDIDSAIEVSRSLEHMGNSIIEKELSKGRAESLVSVSEKLADIGGLAIDRKWEDVLGLIASVLADLSVKCVEWQTPGLYINDPDLQGGNQLSVDAIKETANNVLHLLLELNLNSMETDVLLAARNTKRPLSYAYISLINKRLDNSFYEDMCSVNIMPLVRAIQQPQHIRFDWIPYIADILTAAGIESVETLGKGSLENTLKGYLVWIAAKAPSEKSLLPEDVITSTMAGIFNFINGVKSNAGAIWLAKALEGIGVEYNNKGFNSPPRKVLTHLGNIGSLLDIAGNLFTTELPQQTLDSIDRVVSSTCDQSLRKYAATAIFKIIGENDDKEIKDKALDIFKKSCKGVEQSVLEQEVNEYINEFKSQNITYERRQRLEKFIMELF